MAAHDRMQWFREAKFGMFINLGAIRITTGQPAQARWDGDVLVLDGLPAVPPDKADTVIVVDVEA